MRLLRAGLRLFFLHFYTSLAWSYDAIASLVSIGQWNAWVLSATQSISGSPILELGHGPGHLLTKLDGRAVGVDPSRQMSRLAQRRLRRNGFECRLVRARSQQLPFVTAGFGCLVATFPTEYILDPASIREAWRVMREGAKLVIVASAEIHRRRVLDRWADWLFRVTGQAGEIQPGWSDLLVQAGFDLHRIVVPVLRSNVTQIIATKSASQAIGRPAHGDGAAA